MYLWINQSFKRSFRAMVRCGCFALNPDPHGMRRSVRFYARTDYLKSGYVFLERLTFLSVPRSTVREQDIIFTATDSDSRCVAPENIKISGVRDVREAITYYLE